MGFLDSLTLGRMLIAGFVIRLAIIAYSIWHDEHFVLKYTDIDYFVFSDAARFVTEGQSPFARSTYRYTPLLAYILTPNIHVHMAFGKVLFTFMDLLVAKFAHSILRARGVSDKTALLCTASYLFNPLVINISTRGNADALVAFLALGALHALHNKRLIQAAVWYGLAVHVKIYPIIYALPLVLFLSSDYNGTASLPSSPSSSENQIESRPKQKQQQEEDGEDGEEQEKSGGVIRFISSFLTPTTLTFAIVSASTFLILTGLFYIMYGWEFLWETYLYHLVRTDNRHNFSVYFYYMYLKQAATSLSSASALSALLSRLVGLLAFLPQFFVIFALAFKYHRDIVWCIFLQTIAFVTFNKVCTVQYFVWFFALMPAIFPSLDTKGSWKRPILILALFFGTQGLWLAYAYKLEFLGENTFLQVWAAGLAFFAANIWAMRELILMYKPSPLMDNGRILPFPEVRRKVE